MSDNDELDITENRTVYRANPVVRELFPTEGDYDLYQAPSSVRRPATC